jgi:putative hemolysin
MDPGETSYTAEIFVIALCLMLSALFSAAETAITSLGSLKARHILDNEGRSVRPLTLWLSHPGRVLTTILIFNNLVNILASAIITNLTAQLAQSRALGIATGISTLLVLIFGEIIPKSFGRTHADKVAIPALNGIYAVYTCTAPLVWVFSELANRLVTLIGGVKKEAPPITEEELEFLVNVGERAGVLEETKKDMLVGVFEFDETKVREIMTPRPDIRWITMDATLNEVLSSVVESGMSRIPVCSIDGIDHIVGILLVKDLLRIVRDQKPEKPAFQIRDVMREPFFIPESKPIMEVFKELKSTKNHIAIVIDEHGGTAGLVTMEDILEEIVGDIQDEYDTEEAEIIEIGAGSYDVAGSCNIDEFLDYFELDETLLKDRPEDGIDTISGWLTSRLGELPEVGKTVSIGPLSVQVSEMERHRIKRVHVSRVPPVEAQA